MIINKNIYDDGLMIYKLNDQFIDSFIESRLIYK